MMKMNCRVTAVMLFLTAMTLSACAAASAGQQESQQAGQQTSQQVSQEAGQQAAQEVGQDPQEDGQAAQEANGVYAAAEEAVAEDVEECETKLEEEPPTRVYAEGPYGRISVELPADWTSESYSAGSEKSNAGSYGMRIRPADLEGDGYVDLCYMQDFAVCGTGLKNEQVELAGEKAWVGTYDNHQMWDFVNFEGKYDGIVALTVMPEEWPEYYRAPELSILDSLQFEPDKTTGAVSYFRSDSEIPEIGLIAEAKEITSAGATVCFYVWDPELASGELEYGNDYSLERMEDGVWTAAPIIYEGEWAFTEEAHIISKDPDSEDSRWEVNWEQLYGRLEPGDYRICKQILDFRGAGDYDVYNIYVYFHYAGEA